MPDEQDESLQLRRAAERVAQSLNAIAAKQHEGGHLQVSLGFKLYIDDTKYYVSQAEFMARDRPGEVCTPRPYDGMPTYRCEEGQRLTVQCHLLFFDDKLSSLGDYRIRINEPHPVFCNTIIALGVADKDRNELLVTVQYFPVDIKPASTAAGIGAGWNRMTVKFRVKAVDGKLEWEQDDACLRNPNRIATIPDARAQLKRCASAGK